MHGNLGNAIKYIDLHIHTTFSDGTSGVREVVEMALDKNIRAISITDHDTLDGYPLAVEIGLDRGLEVITGAELSSEMNGIDIHILGYFVDINNIALRQKLQEMKEARYIRAERMVQNLNRQGIDLQFETVLKVAGEGAIGRPHIATAMVDEELVYSFKEAFDKYIGYDSPAYIEKLKMLPKDVFRLILDAGGIPILAHPGITQVDELIPKFVREGLAGIEIYHTEHNSSLKRFYSEYCRKNDLVVTGGSDFHGQTQTRAEIGAPKIPYYILEKLRRRCELIHGYECAQ